MKCAAFQKGNCYLIIAKKEDKCFKIYMPRATSKPGMNSIKMTDFTIKVISLIQKIPKGKVTTYGKIAILAGKPNGSRGVGWILHSCTKSHGLPWQRVLGATGKISFPARTPEFKKQKKLLTAEGVKVSLSGRVDLDIYGWNKKIPKGLFLLKRLLKDLG